MKQVYTQEEIWLYQTKMMAQKNYNFLSNRWISVKFLQDSS